MRLYAKQNYTMTLTADGQLEARIVSSNTVYTSRKDGDGWRLVNAYICPSLAHNDDLVSVTWSPDQSRLAAVSRLGHAVVWSTLTTMVTGKHENVHSVSWNEDATPVFYSGW